ncbi:MAG: hypothetical protein ACHQ0J_11710 [Candidatus Dormibacterales bacterium]
MFTYNSLFSPRASAKAEAVELETNKTQLDPALKGKLENLIDLIRLLGVWLVSAQV